MKTLNTPTPIPVPITFTNLLRLSPLALGFSIVSAIFSSALSIIPFYLIYLIVIELLKETPDNTRIGFLALGVLGLFLLRWLMMALSHIGAHWGAFTLIYRLRLALSQQLKQVPLSFFSKQGSGSLRRTISDDTGSLEGFYAHMLPDTVSAATVPILTLILLFYTDWRLALAVVAPLPLALLAQWWWMARTMTERMNQWADLQKAIANRMGEYVRSIPVIKSFGLDARSFTDLESQVRGAVEWVDDYAKTSTGGFVIFSGLLRSSLVLVVPLGAFLYLQDSLDLATYILFLLVSPLVLEPLLRLMFAWHELLHNIKAFERINEILTAETLQSKPLKQHLPASLETLDIECRQLHYHYEERTALRDISFSAKSGTLTALVGPSGSGKSTILRLIARLDDYDQGTISVAGLDIRDWPLDTLLDKIAIVFQDVFLFNGTVRDNLKLAAPDATDEEIRSACQQAQACEFINSLPLGLDTPLGEDGGGLSGGERQRLSLARAFLKNAPILLLDEATASLDAKNEQGIRQAIAQLCKNRTVLMICHNLHSSVAADQILVIEEGHLIAQGRHEDLLRHCDLYQTLWQDQTQMPDGMIIKNEGEVA